MGDDGDTEPTAGEFFAGYRVVRCLGSGGMGEVYLAEHPRLPRRDALKVLPARVSADPEFRERFNREADLAASLWHPHIVGVHDRGEYRGQLWIAMDYVDGSDTAARLRRSPTGLGRDQVIEIATAVARALDYAHEHQMLHRDVKPANILLTKPGSSNRRIMLADFGIGRWADDISGLTATNMTVGTLSYAAPEQLLGKPIDGRADQYALAATIYHLLVGRPPFHQTNPAVVIGNHLATPPPRLADTHPELADLDAAMARALAKAPTDRFDSCGEFAAALLHSESPAPRHTPAVRLPATPPRSKRSKKWWFAAAAMLVLYLIGRTAPPEPSVPDAAPAPSVVHTTTVTATPPPPPPETTPTSTASSTPAPAAALLDSACSHAQANTTAPAASGLMLRCVSDAHGYSWQLDTGVDQIDSEIVGQAGWRDCLARFPRAECVSAAAELAGSPDSTGPVFPEGSYLIPDSMPYGSYAAEVGPGGSCSYTVYSSTGRVIDTGSRLIALGKPTVDITPIGSGGWLVTSGCTPWVQVAPLPPNW